jgi:hypothetical protein
VCVSFASFFLCVGDTVGGGSGCGARAHTHHATLATTQVPSNLVMALATITELVTMDELMKGSPAAARTRARTHRQPTFPSPRAPFPSPSVVAGQLGGAKDFHLLYVRMHANEVHKLAKAGRVEEAWELQLRLTLHYDKFEVRGGAARRAGLAWGAGGCCACV